MIYRHRESGRLIDVNSTMGGAWEPAGSHAARDVHQAGEKPEAAPETKPAGRRKKTTKEPDADG